MVADELPGCGPLGAIWTGLGHIRGERAFVTACDLPFISPRLARSLYEMGALATVVLPLIRGQTEPLHAVYSRACRPLLGAALARGQLSLQPVLSAARPLLVGEEELRALDPELLSFFNLNTPDDLSRAQALLAEPATLPAAS